MRRWAATLPLVCLIIGTSAQAEVWPSADGYIEVNETQRSKNGALAEDITCQVKIVYKKGQVPQAEHFEYKETRTVQGRKPPVTVESTTQQLTPASKVNVTVQPDGSYRVLFRPGPRFRSNTGKPVICPFTGIDLQPGGITHNKGLIKGSNTKEQAVPGGKATRTLEWWLTTEPLLMGGSEARRLLDSIDAYWTDVFRSCGDTYRPPRLMGHPRPEEWDEKAVYEPDGRLHVPREVWGAILINPVRLFANGENEAHAALAHEAGHRVQDLQNRMRGPSQVEQELEADMLLGVYAKWLKDKGRLPKGFFEAAVSSRRNARSDLATHGTPERRVAAVHYGYEHGLPEHFCSRVWAWVVPW